jgi:nucleoside-diphosphate-sugar epimerase
VKPPQKQKKRIFLTGATGNWGQYILREFAQRADRFDILALVLPTEKDTGIIRRFHDMDNLSVVHGDITDYPTVLSCVTGADYVLHAGAVVSPLADDHPELTHAVNVGGARNVIKAVNEQPDPSPKAGTATRPITGAGSATHSVSRTTTNTAKARSSPNAN